MKTISDFGFRISDLEQGIAEREEAAAARRSSTSPAFSNPQSIELHIDELVLHGFSPGDRYRIAEGLQRELVRLLADPGLSLSPTADIDIERLDGGSFRLPAAGRATVTGLQIAGAVYSTAASAVAPAELPASEPLSAGDVTR